jgi:hypothetical protein
MSDVIRLIQALVVDLFRSKSGTGVRRRGPPSQGWKTFLRNHADGILFVVPTVSFRLLYGLLIMRHSQRRILWLGVTAHPTAEWLANQLMEACGWEPAPTI